MSNQTPVGNEIVERTKEILHAGNIRHVIIKNAEGRTLIDSSLTIAVALSAALIFFIPGGLFIAILVAVAAVYMRLKIEIVRELTDEDEIITLNVEQPEARSDEAGERLRTKRKN